MGLEVSLLSGDNAAAVAGQRIHHRQRRRRCAQAGAGQARGPARAADDLRHRQLQALLAARDLYEFDTLFTAPLHGFRDTPDYWSRASAKPVLHQIRVPALALNALNDPFVPAASLPTPLQVGRHVTLWQPGQGGHVGFPVAHGVLGLPGNVRAMPDAVGHWLLSHL